MRDDINPLIGKVLTGVHLAKDRQAILFNTTDGDVEGEVDADCCSYTWIEHVELPALGLPATVTAVEDLMMMPEVSQPSPFHPESDCLQFYGCKITTDRGEIIIDYRNDSNGYYGGNLIWPGDYGYGRYKQNVSNEEWNKLA